MKSLNVKKLAALAVGATMVLGTAAAAVANNLPTDRSWYLDSKIVVGSNAAASDVVSAAEISAAIAQLAYKKAEIQGGNVNNAQIVLSAPGKQVAVGDTVTEKISNVDLAWSATGVDATVAFDASSHDSYGHTLQSVFVQNQPFTFKYQTNGGTWTSETGQLSNGIVAGVDFYQYQPNDSDQAQLRMKFKPDTVAYELNVTDVSDLNWAQDYNFNGFYVNLLGTKFEITSYDATNKSFHFVASKEDVTVPVGQSTEFEGYKIVVGDIDPNANTAYLKLEDMNGDVIATDIVKAGDYTDFGGDLNDSIKVDAVFAGTTEKFAKLSLTASSFDLAEGADHQFPGLDNWYVTWTKDTDGSLYFKVYYDGDEYTSTDTGLTVGQVFKFPNTDYSLALMGFQPANELYKFSIDNTSAKVIGEDGDHYTVTMFQQSSINSGRDGYVYEVRLPIITDETTGQTYQYAVDFNMEYNSTASSWDVNAALYKYDSTNGKWNFVDTLSGIDQNGDNILIPTGALVGGISYDVMVVGDQTKDQPTSAEAVLGKVAGEYYTVSFDDKDSSDSLSNGDYFDVAAASTVAPAEIEVPVYFDTSNNPSIDFTEDSVSLVGASGITSVNYKSGDSVPENAWFNDGAYVDLTGPSALELVIPDESEDMGVAGGMIKQVTSGGEITVSVGQQIPDTAYTVKAVKGVANISGTYYEQIKALDPTSMVYLDTQEPSGNLIVVGGYAINQIAAKIQQLKQDLTKENTVVVKYYPASETGLGSDAIVVAGWTAQDTMTAARQFIQFLKTSVQ